MKTTIALPKPKARSTFEKVRWGAGEITLISQDDGATWVGTSGEDRVLITVRRGQSHYVARLEDRVMGNSWASEPKRVIQVAVASLHREVKRIARAGAVRMAR